MLRKIAIFRPTWFKASFMANRNFGGYSCAHTHISNLSGNSEKPTRGRKCRKVMPINCYRYIRSFIFSTLLLNRCPSTILWRVVLVGVKSVNSEPVWSRPYILKERFKTMHPTITNFNSAATPVWVVFTFNIVTTPFHA